MKRSNLLLLILSVVLLSGLFITDRLLVLEYAKINLSDPYKNFESIAVLPFKALKISGGNGYAVRVKQGEHFNIRLMHSRKAFFKMNLLHDTLFITFAVANQSYQKPEESTVGLIVFVPKVSYLEFSGTNNEIGPLQLDSLVVRQNENTVTRLREIQLDYLSLHGNATSYFDFQFKNQVQYLHVNIKNRAVVNLHEVSVMRCIPLLQDSAAIVVYKESLTNILYR